MLISFFVTLLITFPLWAQFRGKNVFSLFGMAALAHACVALVIFYEASRPVKLSSSMGLVIIMLFFMGLVSAQERVGAMAFPKATKVLFWITHLAFVLYFWFPTLRFLELRSGSFDRAAHGHALYLSFLIDEWLERIAYLALGALVLLAAWSVTVKILKHLVRFRAN